MTERDKVYLLLEKIKSSLKRDGASGLSGKDSPEELVNLLEAELEKQLPHDASASLSTPYGPNPEEAYQQLHSIMETIPGAMLILDTDFNVIETCGEMIKLFDLKNEKPVIGRKCYETFKNRKTSCVECLVSKVLKTGKPSVRMTSQAEEEQLGGIFKIFTTPVKDNRGNIWAIIQYFMELTDIKKAEKAAEEATRAKSEFLANMSHEIRTPLNAIIGFTDILLEKTELNEIQHSSLRIVKDRGKDLLYLINDILDLSKIEAGKMELHNEPIKVAQVLEDVVNSLAPNIAGKKIELICEIDKRIPETVLLDPLRLRQVLLNLLSNAIKFTYEGIVSARVKIFDSSSPFLSNPGFVSSNGDAVMLHFSVADTGIGIAKDAKSKIFEAFTQADTTTTRKFSGTGLGLTISRKLVKMMSGNIWLESTEGKGSTFHFTVKATLSDIPEEQPADAPGPDPLPNDRPINILVVDDDKASRELIKLMSSSSGYNCDQAKNGTQALELAKKNNYDLIIMDVRMPKLDGVQTVSRIREEEKKTGKHIPVFALTAHAMDGDREYFLKSGMDGYLSKPLNRNELDKLLKNL